MPPTTRLACLRRIWTISSSDLPAEAFLHLYVRVRPLKACAPRGRAATASLWMLWENRDARIASDFVVLTIMAVRLFGLAGGYYAQSLEGHVQIMAARKMSGNSLTISSTPKALRARLTSASAIRRFAIDETGTARQ